MKKHLIVLSAGLATLALAGAGVAAATAHPEKTGGTRTIRAIEKITFGHRIDQGPSGPSAGDLTLFGGHLRRAGKRAGSFQGSCTSVSARAQECSLTFSLRGGQIAAQAAYKSKGSTALTPIVGGNGDFRNARGELRERQLSGGKTRLTFHVTG
jgi:hypothetical protein